ncbi:MAG TPA: hypothetical protein VGL35_04610 [Rhizomicrobium sp.]|jgi:hypothetical protein
MTDFELRETLARACIEADAAKRQSDFNAAEIEALRAEIRELKDLLTYRKGGALHRAIGAQI